MIIAPNLVLESNDLFLENFSKTLSSFAWHSCFIYFDILIAMHLQRLSLLFIASSSKKRSWNWTLPWIKAHIELSNTIVYDYKMSTGSSSARNSHLAQWERTTMKPYLRTDLFIREQSIIIKKTTTQPLKEGVTTIFTVVYLYLDSIFLWSFHFALSYNSFPRHEHHCRSFPLEKVRIPRGTAARAHFVVINKGARRFYLNSATR